MRLAVLSSDEMTPEQVGLYREILGGPRGQGPRAVLLATGAGGLAGPFNAMLYAPDVGHALQELGAAIRFRTQLAPRIRELAILVVAQHWDSGYVRSSHEVIGRDAGLTEPEIKALRCGADPGFNDKQEQAAYATVRALVSRRCAGPRACRILINYFQYADGHHLQGAKSLQCLNSHRVDIRSAPRRLRCALPGC